MVVDVRETSQKMENKSLLDIKKNIIELQKLLLL